MIVHVKYFPLKDSPVSVQKVQDSRNDHTELGPYQKNSVGLLIFSSVVSQLDL